jgi:acyl carrier protein
MNELKEKLKAMVAQANSGIIIENDKDFDRKLEEIGLDSLDFMSVLFSVQDEFGLEIPDEDIEQLTSLSALAEYISEKK